MDTRELREEEISQRLEAINEDLKDLKNLPPAERSAAGILINKRIRKLKEQRKTIIE